MSDLSAKVCVICNTPHLKQLPQEGWGYVVAETGGTHLVAVCPECIATMGLRHTHRSAPERWPIFVEPSMPESCSG